MSDADPAAAAIFAGLRAGALDEIRRRSVVRAHPRGAVLWRAGASAEGIHVLLRGRVRVLQVVGARQHLVHAAEAGATLGEVPLFAGGGYPATAVAATDVLLAYVAEDGLRAAIEADPGLGVRLLERMAHRVRGLVGRLGSHNLTPVRARVAASLLAAADLGTHGLADVGGTQAEWAEDLGTVREVLARELAALRRAGLVERVGRGRYRILDDAGLERVATTDRPGRP